MISNLAKRRCIAALLLICICLAGRLCHADEFDVLRLKWRDMLTQGTNANTADPNYSNWIASVSSTAQRYFNSLNTSPSRTYLWSDLNHLGSDSSDISGSYGRLQAMALGYAVHTSSLETNAGLLLAITNALDWMYTNYYNETKIEYDNFFDWEIAAPLDLNDTAVLLYDRLTPAQMAHYMTAIEHFAPVPNLTAANKVWKASVVAVRGAIVKDPAKLVSAVQALSDIFPYSPGGDGFYPDGSFIFHVLYPYNGGYGTQLIETIGPLMQWLKGSSWEVTDPSQTNLFRWVYDAFQPLIYNGALMQMVSGRYYTRLGDDHVDAHDLISAILRLAQLAPTNDAIAFRAMAKAWIQKDTFRNFLANQPPPYNLWAQAALNDPTLLPRPELVRHYQFPHMDRAVHLRPGWGFGLSMSSVRIGNYESIRGENLRGWYTADGMTYLYNGDLGQFADNYWPTVNPYRLPGTTVDTQVRTNGSGDGYLSPTNWTGGASLQNLYGVSGMQLNAWNSSLGAKKSWFMFDNEVVCLGAGITSLTDNRTIETTIDNRRLGVYGDNPFTVNGVTKPETLSWSETLTNVLWAHLAGNTLGSDVGYYFPQPTNVNALRESRSGALIDLNTTYGSTNRVTRNFLTLWFDHGINPSNAAYSYVLLPNASASQVAAYAASPDIQILGNSTTAQGVKENALGITAVNFWKDGTNRLGGITVDKKSSVIIRNDGTYLDIGISDPTQVNPGVINLEISSAATTLLSADPTISVQQLTPTVKVAVNINGAGGQTCHARFFVGAVQTITNSPVADAYVQNGDQTNVNFGSLNTLAVKAATNSQGRESFLKFDLSSTPGVIFSANLRLFPFTIQDPLNHALAYVPDNSWTESGITWNNKPASSNEFTRWLLGAVNTPILIPVTPLAQQAASADGKLSLRIYSTGTPTPVNGGYTAYASREHTTVNNRPQLILSVLRIPPTITLNLLGNSVLDAPATVGLSADAQDSDGTITNVQIFRGITKIAQFTSAPYALNVPGLSPGQYTFTAVAIDNSGLISTSSPIAVAVYSAQPSGKGTGLNAEYFTTKNLTGLQSTQIDPVINTNWGTGSPNPAIPPDGFSIRWLGKLQARHAGIHQIHVVSDEGVRLWLGGQLLIDDWNPHGPTEDTALISLLPGEYYDLALEYYEGTGLAMVQLLWTEPGSAKQVIPQSQLYPADSGLRGFYYASTNFTKPALSRVDDIINFYWGNSTPEPTLIQGGFSIQWKGKVRANAAGLYTFYTLSDDAVKLTVNGQMIISNWVPHTATENSGTIALTNGQFYNITMDFFDANGNATAVLMWQPPGEAKQVIPSTNLTPNQNNNPPVLNPVPNVALNPGHPLTFTATATDPDLPYQTLTFSLDPDSPAGASINPSSGVFSWSPPANQVQGNYAIIIRVTDNGNPVMTDAQSFIINVSSNLSTTYLALSPTGSVWRCLDTGVDPGPNWRNVNFSDASWKTGAAILGYGNGAESTSVSFGPNANTKYPTTYFRRPLYVPDASRVLSLDARLLRNDGVVLYLNGTEIWRDNLPVGAISNATMATSQILGLASSNYLSKSLSPSLLVDGTNILAAEVHQSAANGPDLAFDLELKGFATVPTQAPLSIGRSGNTLALTWPADATWLQLFTSTNLVPPVFWTRATNAPVLSNGQWSLQLPVDPNQMQFFRLQSQ